MAASDEAGWEAMGVEQARNRAALSIWVILKRARRLESPAQEFLLDVVETGFLADKVGQLLDGNAPKLTQDC